MPAIPTSTSVSESAVIDAPFSDVWHLIKLQDFSKFWSKLEKSEFVKGTSPETDVVQWTFKDGQTLEVKQEEHSVSIALTLREDKTYVNVHRASTTSSPTPSSLLSPSSATPQSSPPSAHTPSPPASTRARPLLPGLVTSRLMPTRVCTRI